MNINTPETTLLKLESKKYQLTQLLMKYRRQNLELKRGQNKAKHMNELLYSSLYQNKIQEVLQKYQQFKLTKLDYEQIMERQDIKPDQVESIKNKNQELRYQIQKLQGEIIIQKEKQRNLDQYYQIYQKYLTNLQTNKLQCENIIHSHQIPYDSFEHQTFKQRIRDFLTEKYQLSGGQLSQNELEQIQYDCIDQLILTKSNEIDKILNLIAHTSITLAEKKLIYEQMKGQREKLNKRLKLFNFDLINTPSQLHQQEQDINQQLANIMQEIQTERQEQNYLTSNCQELAKNQAFIKTKDYVNIKLSQSTKNRKTVQQILPLACANNNHQIRQQAESIKKQLDQLIMQENQINKWLQQQNQSIPIS